MRKYEIDPQGHEWARDIFEGVDAGIDIFAYKSGSMCNGPKCVKCGMGFCHHCHDDEVPSECPA